MALSLVSNGLPDKLKSILLSPKLTHNSMSIVLERVRTQIKARGAKTKVNKSPAMAKKAPADSTKKKNTLAAGSGGEESSSSAQ